MTLDFYACCKKVPGTHESSCSADFRIEGVPLWLGSSHGFSKSPLEAIWLSLHAVTISIDNPVPGEQALVVGLLNRLDENRNMQFTADYSLGLKVSYTGSSEFLKRHMFRIRNGDKQITIIENVFIFSSVIGTIVVLILLFAFCLLYCIWRNPGLVSIRLFTINKDRMLASAVSSLQNLYNCTGKSRISYGIKIDGNEDIMHIVPISLEPVKYKEQKYREALVQGDISTEVY